jgi:hypothetical protein
MTLPAGWAEAHGAVPDKIDHKNFTCAEERCDPARGQARHRLSNTTALII